VVAVLHATFQEVGHAFVVARPGHRVDTAALTAFLRERIPNYKIPKTWSVLDARRLRDPAQRQGRQARDAANARDPSAPVTVAIYKWRCGGTRVPPSPPAKKDGLEAEASKPLIRKQ
jgi:hypothetical protein